MKAFTLIILLTLSSFCHANDMQKYMEETEDLVNMKKYEEALERTIWFHNHALENDMGMYGVRLSFALGNWHDLGKKYPPALVSLKQIRDKNTNQLLSGSGSRNIFVDVASINGELSEKHKTISLFKKLDKNNPKLAKDVWLFVKNDVILGKDHELISKYIGNILNEYTILRDSYARKISSYKTQKQPQTNKMVAWHNNDFVEQVLRLISLSISIKDIESAVIIKNNAKNIVKDKRLDNVKIN